MHDSLVDPVVILTQLFKCISWERGRRITCSPGTLQSFTYNNSANTSKNNILCAKLSIRKYLDFCDLNQMSHLYTVLCENNQHTGANILDRPIIEETCEWKIKPETAVHCLGAASEVLNVVSFGSYVSRLPSVSFLSLWPHVLMLNLFSVWCFGDFVRVRKAVW